MDAIRAKAKVLSDCALHLILLMYCFALVVVCSASSPFLMACSMRQVCFLLSSLVNRIVLKKKPQGIFESPVQSRDII